MGTFRKIVGKISFIIKKSTILLIKIYRGLVSPILGNRCRFYPSCSWYAQIAIERFGICHGLWLSLKRVLKCHPWHKDGYDPVPEVERIL